MTIWENLTSGAKYLYLGLENIFSWTWNGLKSVFSSIDNSFFSTDTTWDNNFENVVFYGNYSIYGSNYQVEDISWHKITKPVYAFAMVGNSNPNPDGVSGEWKAYENYRTLPSTIGGYATGKTGTANDKYIFEIFSTDPYSDLHYINPSKYNNGTKNKQNAWEYGKNTIAKFIEAANNSGKPAILSIGGWSCGITLLDAMKKDPSEFAKAVADFINTTVPDACKWTDGSKGFKGVDIDIEPYENNWAKMSKDEIKSVVESMAALRKALGDKLISFTIGATPNIVKIVQNAGNEYKRDFWQEINKAVDKVYIMTYDYHGTFDGSSSGTNFHTALYPDLNEPTTWGENRGKFNIDSSMKEFSSVLPKDKLLFGVASYGRAYKMREKFSDDEFSQYTTGKKNFVADFLYKNFIDASNGDNLTPVYKANTNLASIAGNLGYSEDIYANPHTHNEVNPADYANLPQDGTRSDGLDAKINYTQYAKGYSISDMLKNGDMVEALIYISYDGKTRTDVIKYKGKDVKIFVDNREQGSTYKIASDDKLIGACGLNKNGYFLTYDNPETVAAKAQYCKDNGYGGILHWEAKGDVAGELVTAAADIFGIN